MLSKESVEIVNRAYMNASRMASQYFTREHILAELIKFSRIAQIFDAVQSDVTLLRVQLDQYLSQGPRALSAHQKPLETTDYQTLVQYAGQYSEGLRLGPAPPEILLLAFYGIPTERSPARFFLESAGLTLEVLQEYLTDLSNKNANPGGGSTIDPMGASPNAAKNFLINLNEKAKENRIDPIIGRDKEIDRVIHILVRKKKNNPILTGEPGVGKTAIAEGLAKKIVEKTSHESLWDHTVYALDLGALTAGTKFRGEFEDRLKKVLDKLKKEPKSILFIDEIHSIIGSGAAGGSLDASNLLKPTLASGEIKCMGATTYKEYRNIFEKDGALSRRFQKVEVEEPSVDAAKQILFGLKNHYEKFHNVTYTDRALTLAVELSVKYITDRFLPDKAIDIIDEAGAYGKLNSVPEINEDIIEKVIAKMARLPEKQVARSEKEKIKELKSNLEMTIFGQNEAIETLVDSILLSKSGLRENNKPIGSYLFCGPSGVGKTEVTKQLAAQLGVNFVRIDMSEYMEKHNVSKLIGAPPGYVGFDQEGVLSSAVSKNPHSVILLDELEKAHPDVWNIMLQVMDNGILTDNYGKKIDFRQCVIVMTSNVGSGEVSARRVGLFGDSLPSKPTNAIEKTFSPEFRNRLDAIIWFNPLSDKTIRSVLDKNLVMLDAMLMEKKVSVTYSEETKDWLAKKGYDPLLGARPMARLIQDKIKGPLSKEILFGKLEHGGTASVDIKDDQLIFTFKEKKEKKKTEPILN